MRFNDLLRTVLANGGDGTASAVTRWRQCIDLVAQYDVSGAMPAHRLTEDDAVAVFKVLTDLRSALGPEQRVAPIIELGGRLRSVRLCRFLAQDHPAIVSAVMVRARLIDEDWAAIIPMLGPLARSILRRRSDMGPSARAALDRFGPTDLALPAAAPAQTFQLFPANDATPDAGRSAPELAGEGPAIVEEQSEIRRIVERIERFTASRALVVESGPLDLNLEQRVAASDGPGDSFSFETDEKGRFTAAEGAPRAAVIGLTIGQAALDGLSGADGQALGACRRRAAFRDARFAIAGGVLAGNWRISGEPRFDRASGLFRGYVGTARRELAHEEMVRSTSEPTDWGSMSAAAARQLIHELRTPLSAIYAYAEMIEGQLVGPVSAEYRELAGKILEDARMLASTFDDLDLAGQLAREEDRHAPTMIDIVGQLRAIVQRYLQSGSNCVVLEASNAMPAVWGDREQLERMFTHLVRAGFAALEPGETLVVRLRHLPVTGTLSVAIDRPAALRGLDEASLLDHGSSIDQGFHDGPPLGLAFTLRLVRSLAGRSGGQLLFSPDLFELVLPCESQGDKGRERGS
jgi:signal transduction histidine kinase